MRWLAVLALLACLPVLAAQDNADESARIEALISNLASEDWPTRERATRELAGMGEKARKPLRKALTHDDAEVRVRASGALIRIGEEFAYAVECATGDNAHLKEHGRAALMNLFRIDNAAVLREMTQQEMQVRRFGFVPSLAIMKAPQLAMAQLTAASGRPVVVSREALEQYSQVLLKPQLNIQVSGDPRQMVYVRDALNRAFQQALGNPPPERALVARPMRLGQAMFFYVTLSSGGGDGARCGRELIDHLLADDERRVVAASLLAEGAAGDTEAAERIRREYHANPGIELLQWLALALGADDRTRSLASAADVAPAMRLLASGNWIALDMSARFIECLAPARKGELLSPVIESSTDAIQLSCALWMAKDCPLSEPARARVVRLLASRQDSLAAGAARWLTGAGELSDAELAAVWKGAETMLTGSEFFRATLEMVSRPEVARRLEGPARTALASTRAAQQALAAEVLKGVATPADMQTALEKLSGATNDPLLARQLISLLRGADALTDGARARLLAALTDANPVTRAVFTRALRALDGKLRRAISDEAMKALLELAGKPKDGDDPWKDAPVYVVAARITMLGIQIALGDANALEAISAYAEGANPEHAKAAGAAIVDALAGEVLFQTLDDWKTRAGLVHGQVAALESYLELCRRAVETGDRATFRRAFAAASTINVPNAWQVRNELSRLQVELAGADKPAGNQRLPQALNLTQRDSDVK